MTAAAEGGAFAAELRAAIVQSGLTLTSISQRLRARHRPVSVATLSNWQSGRSLPSGEKSMGVIAALEELLGRSPESLAELVGGPRLRGRAVRTADHLGHLSSKEVFHDALEELGFLLAQQYAHERVVHQLAVIDTARERQSFDFRLIVRALESGVCRLPAVYVLEESEPNVAPIFTALDGCSIGRRVNRPERRVYGVEFVIDGTLDAGQVASLAYRVELGARATDVTAVLYSLPRRSNDVLLEVEFRGDRRPVDCHRYQRTESGESITDVRLDHRGRLQVSEARFGPGTLGLRWDWEDGQDDGDEGDDDRCAADGSPAGER